MSCWHLMSNRFQTDPSYPRLKIHDSLTLISLHLPDPQRNQIWPKFCTSVALKSIYCVSSVSLLGYHHLLPKLLRQHLSLWGHIQSVLLPAFRVVLLKKHPRHVSSPLKLLPISVIFCTQTNGGLCRICVLTLCVNKSSKHWSSRGKGKERYFPLHTAELMQSQLDINQSKAPGHGLCVPPIPSTLPHSPVDPFVCPSLLHLLFSCSIYFHPFFLLRAAHLLPKRSDP